MNKSTKRQSGQALVLIVFAIVALIGLSGLAIDGGNVYSDRRHAQNAADTAAMAAGLRIVKQQTDWQQAGYAQAAANGYLAAGPDSTVDVYRCDNVPSGKPACVYASTENPANFVQVVITSTVHTYFAPVLGIRTITNQVLAMAKAVPTIGKPWYNGNALVATETGCKPQMPNDPFTTTGSSVQIIGGSNILVNSTCPGAFIDGGNANSLTAPGICINGGVQGGVGSLTGINPLPTTNCGQQLDPASYQPPPISDSSCDTEGTGGIVNMGSYLYAKPGRYSGTFPPGSGGNLRLGRGIYCLQNGIQISGSWNVTTDLNNDGIHNTSTEGALLYIENGGVNIAGGSNVNLHAINSTSGDLGPDLVNYLLIMDPNNTNSVSITGGGTNQYVGTIIAPSSLITLSGGSGTDSLNMQTQIIGQAVKLAGGGSLSITYNSAQNATTYSAPQLTPYK